MVVLTMLAVPEDGLRHTQENTSARVNDADLGSGTLYIAESSVTWLNEEGQGFLLEYPSISLHAVSRDLTSFPRPCLYVMVDGKLDMNEDVISSDDDDVTNDPEPSITEIRFVPANPDSLDAVFSAMSDCQVLHPDEDASFSDEEDYCGEEEAGGIIVTASGDQIGAYEGQEGDVNIPGGGIELQPHPNGHGGHPNQCDDQFENADEEN